MITACRTCLICLTMALLVATTASAQSDAFPDIRGSIHNNGRLYNIFNNNGITGNFFGFGDSERSQAAPSFYYPRYSRIPHGIFGALWVGGVVGRDTLVTTAIDETWIGWWSDWTIEFWPDFYPGGAIETRSIDPSSPYYHPGASAQLEYEAHYTDTFYHEPFVPYNNFDSRFHQPLNLHITQTSYSWGYKYAEDFIIVDYAIENIGDDPIRSAFAGIYYVGAVYHVGELPYPRLDDMEGYLATAEPELEECGLENMRIAWICDNDGQPNGGTWDFMATRNTLGIAPLRVPRGAYLNNFNWWVHAYGLDFNWGPRKAGTFEDPFRSFYGGLGNPLSDRNRYYLMAHQEIDYSGYEAGRDNSDRGWLPPFEYATEVASGHPVRFVTSFGPFDLAPRQTEHLTIVYAIGEEVHTNPIAFREHYDQLNPEPFLEYLNFDDLITNIRWAKRVFDNPGVDTDRDGDSGRYVYHYLPTTGDSVKFYCSGDSVPDFRGATPPPPPQLRLTTEDGKIVIRWNGRQTEQYFDTFTGIQDFEGYRVYLARSTDENDISMLASYDREDYNRHWWHPQRLRFELTETPFTSDSLRLLYGPDFDPLAYSNADPFYFGEGIYYFTRVDYNQSDLLDPTGIHKLYPDAALDTTDVDEEGRMRYFEYECVIDGLLPSVPYYVAVTAFDFGFPAKSLEALESSPAINLTQAFATAQGEQVLENGRLNVYCYPNPYRIDADYTGNGYENRNTELSSDRARNIYFANLPNQCTISIYSLDGDLIREIEHDEPPGSATASTERFDMITRNTQALVSGLYYWVVESEVGTQIGKMVIIK